MSNLVGQQLGDYHILSRLGEGGMATVYKAGDLGLSRYVAIKVIRRHLLSDDEKSVEFIERLEREAEAVAKLRHPNIVRVQFYGFDLIHEVYYMVMEFIEGPTLAAHLKKRQTEGQPFTLTEITPLFNALTSAIDYAHTRRVIHRDLKPANIMFTDDGQVVLTDFGIARLLDAPGNTESGAIMGTPAYMSPEQASGQRGDERSDIYALGVILYELLTGRVPFADNNPLAVLHKHLTEPPPRPTTFNPNLPEAVEQVILKALQKNPVERYRTAGTLAQALAQVVDTPSPTLLKPAPLTKTENPFFYGGAVPPERFYGRRELLQTIVQRVGGRTAQSISIVGERRIGKTSLLNYLKTHAHQLFSPRLNCIIIYLDLMRANCHNRTGLMHTLRFELTRAWREPWPPAADGDLSAFDFALEELQAEDIHLILCLDQMEHLTQRAAEFNDVLEDWRACGSLGQMALITASGHPLADLCTTGGLTSPFYNIFDQRWLGLLAPAEWQALVTDNMAVTGEELTFIAKVAGGQPFFTQIAASYLWEARTSHALDYERLYRELWVQIEPFLKHLWSKLSLPEQAVLRQLATPGSPPPDARIFASLERRGLTRAGQPFSQLFAEMIASGYLG